MSLINFSNIQDATTIDAADVNSPLNTIYNDYNGNIDSTNIKDGALDSSTYGTGTVTNAALAGGITYAKLLSTIFSGQVQTQANTGTAGGNMWWVNLGGIKIMWGLSASVPSSVAGNSYAFTLPAFFTTTQSAFSSATNLSAQANQYTDIYAFTTDTLGIYACSSAAGGSLKATMLIIGT